MTISSSGSGRPESFDWERKRVPVGEDGVPVYSMLRELARDPRSGIVEVEPGWYFSSGSPAYPRG